MAKKTSKGAAIKRGRAPKTPLPTQPPSTIEFNPSGEAVNIAPGLDIVEGAPPDPTAGLPADAEPAETIDSGVTEELTRQQREASLSSARQSFLSRVMRDFRFSADTENRLRQDQLDDLRFSHGDQWPPEIKAERDRDGRPCLTIDRLEGPIKQTVNQQRQARPSIQINPVDDLADPKTAEILQGLVRHIEIQSDADAVYGSVGDRQVRVGRAFFQITTEFTDDDGFEQEIYIRRVRNSFRIYPDPRAQRLDSSDMRFLLEVEDITPEEHRRRWPQAKVSSASNLMSIGDATQGWFPSGLIRVANYWYIDEVREERSQVQFSDGRTTSVNRGDLRLPPPDVTAMLSAQGQLGAGQEWALAPLQPADGEEPGFELVKVLQSRAVLRKKVKVAKINGVEVLEGNEDLTAGRDWLGSFIPWCIVTGQEYDIDGQVDYQGIVRKARDPQRMSNYWKSSMTEQIAIAPRAPFVGYEGQFEGHELQWKQSNRRNFPYLEVRPMVLGGQPAPLPQRQAFEPPIQAMVYASQQAENDLRAVTGWTDVQERETQPEQSGRAILARQAQSELNNSNYLENLSFAIRHAGRIIVDLIQKGVYSTFRVRRIAGIDDEKKVAAVHGGQPPMNPDTGEPATVDELKRAGIIPKDVSRIFDLSVGKYDVTISVGPSYQSRRQEAVEAIGRLVTAYPALMQIAGDLFVEQMDWPKAREIAQRLKKALDPRFLESETGEPLPEQLQAQITQMGEQMQQVTQAFQQLQQEQQTKALELAAEERMKREQLASQERIALMRVQADLVATNAKISEQRAERMLDARMAEISQRLEHLHELRVDAQSNESTVQQQILDARIQQATEAQAQQQAGAILQPPLVQSPPWVGDAGV